MDRPDEGGDGNGCILGEVSRGVYGALSARGGDAETIEGVARIIHDGSWRNHAVAWRDGRVEPREPEAYLKQYVEGTSGEPARLAAGLSAATLVAAANP